MLYELVSKVFFSRIDDHGMTEILLRVHGKYPIVSDFVVYINHYTQLYYIITIIYKTIAWQLFTIMYIITMFTL